jgi:hypothetical protein
MLRRFFRWLCRGDEDEGQRFARIARRYEVEQQLRGREY